MLKKITFMQAKFHLILVLISITVLSACVDAGYYLQSVQGHYAIMQQKKDIDSLLEDEQVPEKLKQRLRLVQGIRSFAFTELGLPRSDSYTEYADLKRGYALKNLFAAEEFSISAKQWCYPIVGCAGYRGFFDQQRLQDFADDLQRQHYDVYVANVSAYSTLGWFDDPVLNTFINWPDELLAGLIFHELAHQQLYVDGDSRFNESFASAVQQAGVEKWLQQQGWSSRLQKYRQRQSDRQQVFDLIKQARQDLHDLYQESIGPAEKRRRKAEYLQQLKQRYEAFSDSIQHNDGFQRWFEGELNNAKLVSVSTYYDWVPLFARMLSSQQDDFVAFYQQVEQLAELSRSQREQCFNAWVKGDQQSPLDVSLCTR